MKDIQTCTRLELALAMAQRTGSVNGTVIDRHGCMSMDFNFLTGAVTTADASNYFTCLLQAGTLADGTDMVDVPVGETLIDGTPGWETGAAYPKIDGTGDANKAFCRVSYLGKKRYVRPRAAETGTADAVIGVVVLKGHLNNES